MITRLKTVYQRILESLRWQLTLLLAGAVLITLLLLSTVVFLYVLNVEERSWQGRQGEAARYAAQTLDVFLRDVQATMALFGSLETLELENQLTLQQAIIADGQAILEIVHLNAQGKVIASTARDTVLLSNLFTVTQSNWFRQAASGNVYLGEVQISPEDEPFLIIALPAANGGIVATRLRMQLLWDVATEARFGETGRMYVVNQDGRIVSHTNPQIPLDYLTLQGRPELASMLAVPGHRWSGTYSNFEGVKVVGVTIGLPESDWIVVTELSQAEAFASSRNVLSLLVLGALGIGALVFITINRYLNKTLFRPMEALQQGAEEIGKGNFLYQLDERVQHEVGQTAVAFNHMVQRLQLRDVELAKQQLLLETEVAERLQVEKQIRATLNEKDILLKEVHHRVKNNLQVISSLLYLQANKIEDVHSRNIFIDSRNRVRSMALIHERLYRSGDLAHVEFGIYIQNLVRYLSRSYTESSANIQFRVDAEEIGLGIDTAVPCGLIVNELVSNAIKHAFPNGRSGEIYIGFHASHTPDQLIIQVRDNGVGFPMEHIETGESLGLQLVHNLVRQLNGTLQVHNEEGTTFEVLFAPE